MQGVYKLANLSLAVSLTGTLIFYPLRHTFWGGLFHAGCSAALAGGLADWFAVTALFRHPLGLKIPHTAIIEKNKNALINNIANLVQDEMLPLKVIEQNINRFNFIDKILNYFQTANGKNHINNLILFILKELIALFNINEVSKITSKRILRKLKKVDTPELLISILDWVSLNSYDEIVLDHLLKEIIILLQKDTIREWIEKIIYLTVEDYKEGGILRRFGINISVKLDILNYREAAEKIQSQGISILQDIREDKNNEYRIKIRNRIFHSFRGSLASDINTRNTIKNWKTELISRIPVESKIQNILTKTLEKIKADINSNPSIALKVIQGVINEQIMLISLDKDKQDDINRWIKLRLIKLVAEEIHPRLASIVKDNLNSLDNKAVVSIIEKRAGKDLQYIRINGAIVGGTVGILLYLLELLATRLGL